MAIKLNYFLSSWKYCQKSAFHCDSYGKVDKRINMGTGGKIGCLTLPPTYIAWSVDGAACNCWTDAWVGDVLILMLTPLYGNRPPHTLVVLNMRHMCPKWYTMPLKITQEYSRWNKIFFFTYIFCEYFIFIQYL